MTFWPLTNSDFPTDQTSHQFHDLYTEPDLHRIMSGFHGAFATGVASQQGTLTLPDTWFRPRIWDLLVLQLLRPNSSNLPCLYSTFHLEYPLVLSRFCHLIVTWIIIKFKGKKEGLLTNWCFKNQNTVKKVKTKHIKNVIVIIIVSTKFLQSIRYCLLWKRCITFITNSSIF